MIHHLQIASVEGSIARVLGVEFDECPYDVTVDEPRNRAWRYAWRLADQLLELNVSEAARVLSEDEAA